jgi:hypothetical protein
VTIGLTFLYLSVVQALRSGYPGWYPFKPLPAPNALDGPLPFLRVFDMQIQRFITYIFLLGFFVFLWNGLLKKPVWRILAIILIIIALTPNEAKEMGEFIFSWAKILTFLALLIAVSVHFWRNNTLISAVSIFGYTILLGAMTLIPEGGYEAVFNSIIVIGLGFIILLWSILGIGRHKI